MIDDRLFPVNACCKMKVKNSCLFSKSETGRLHLEIIMREVPVIIDAGKEMLIPFDCIQPGFLHV